MDDRIREGNVRRLPALVVACMASRLGSIYPIKVFRTHGITEVDVRTRGRAHYVLIRYSQGRLYERTYAIVTTTSGLRQGVFLHRRGATSNKVEVDNDIDTNPAWNV